MANPALSPAAGAEIFATTKTPPVALMIVIWAFGFVGNFLVTGNASVMGSTLVAILVLIAFTGVKFTVQDRKVVTKAFWGRRSVPISEISDVNVVEGFWLRQFGLAGVAYRRGDRVNIFSNAKDAPGLAAAIQSNGAK